MAEVWMYGADGKMYPKQFTAPIARTTDPATSHEAAEAITKSGKRQTQAERVLEYIKANPGSCGGKVGHVLEIEGCWKRVSDLKNAGKIYANGTQMWRGRKQLAWYAVGEE